MMEFDEIVVKESPGLCRCCLSEGCYKDLGTEYTWMNETEVYADMLLECFDISITQHNDGPNGPNRLICEVCITRLRDACNFKKQVLDSEKKFIDMMGRGEFRPKMLIYQTQMKCEDTVEAPIEEADVEYLEDDIDFADVSEELIKDETEPSVSDVTVATLPVKGKRGRPRKNAVKPEKRPKVDDKAKTSKAVAKDGLSRRQEGCTYERLRKNLKILFNHTTIIPFKWRGKYICFYCGINFTGITEFRNHTKSHGLCSTEDDSLKRIKGTNVEIKLDVSEINCEICREPFETFEEIIDHLIGKHNMEYDKSIDTPFQVYRLVDGKCLHCEKHFSYFGYLVQHVNSVHPQNCFTCNDCGLTCNKKRDLAVHIRNYHRPKGYPCELCSKDFKNNHALQRHLNSAHFMQCMSCGLRLASLALLQKHTIAEHPQNEDSRKCGYCSKEFNTSQGLRQHLSQCKVKLIPSQQPEEPVDEKAYVEPKKKQNIYQIRQNIQCVLNMSTAVPFKFFSQYSCFYCSKKFVEFDELRQHTTAEHPVCDSQCKGLRACIGKRSTIKIDISELACKVCGLPMPNLEDLVNHLIEEHEAKYDTSITGCLDPYRLIKDNIPCPKCPDTVFRYFRNLLRHINSIHSNNNTICDFCGQRFNDVMNLNVHIKNSHTGSCECDVCGLKFKNRLKLARHRATVHNVKNHKCPQCTEKFVSDYQMQKHLLKIHKIGHKCSYCGQMFTNDSSMVKHVRRLHFNEKKFECTVCYDKFFDVQRLKVHMVKHVGEMKFHCDICGKMFGWKKNLRRHVATHKL